MIKVTDYPQQYPLSPGGQALAAKRGEVAFRRALCDYRSGEGGMLPEEFDEKRILPMLLEAVERTRQDFANAVPSAPPESVLDVGAEYCHRAAALASLVACPVVAIDISLDSLLYAPSICARLGLTALPYRVCCDMTALPFSANTFEVVMSYQTLHHFSDPGPALREISRVTRELYIAVREPTRRRLKWNVGMKKHGIYSAVELNKSPSRRLVEETFFEPRCNELLYGVIENDKLTMGDWRRLAETYFTSIEWFLGPAIDPRLAMRGPRGGRLHRIAAELLGGNLSWQGRPLTAQPKAEKLRALDFVCSSCLLVGREIPLDPQGERLACNQCGDCYPIYDGVPVLLPRDLRAELYPELD